MFEDFIKKIKELERTKLSVPIDLDRDGYLDRECPSDDCLYIFKVKGEDWNSMVAQDVVYCPMCRHQAGKESWFTTEQIEKGREEGLEHVKSLFHNSLSDSARKFNARQPRNAFISLKMTVTPKKPIHYIMPISAMEEMNLKIECAECKLRYSVIGSAFFCPCCGHNSADETFDNSIRKIKAKLNNLGLVRKAVAQVSKDDAETTCRSMIESSLNEMVVAFQRFCEVSFQRLSPTTKLKFNAFQNLEIGGDYWLKLFGESYSDWLSAAEFSAMNILFQKRHLLSHTEGIVDDKYVLRSGDSSYRSGQRIVVKEKDVENLINIVCKIVERVRTMQTNSLPNV
jgi:hypothetical protein